MRILFLKIVVVFVVVALLSCSQTLPERDYIKWIRSYENGLHINRMQAPFVFDVQYLPLEYRQLTGNVSNAGFECLTIDIYVNDPSKSILNHEVNDPTEISKRQYYFSYQFQDAISLEVQGRKYPCTLFHFEQTELSNKQKFIVGFEIPECDATSYLLEINSPFFGSLPVRMTVHKKDLPKLKV